MNSSEAAQAAHWMRQAAACRRIYAASHDRYWANATRVAVSVARAHREAVQVKAK